MQNKLNTYLHNINFKIYTTDIDFRNHGSREIELECNHNHKFNMKLHTINVYRNKNVCIVCPECKAINLKKKTEDNSKYNMIENDKISCKNCNTIYCYSNLKMKCYCELKIKQQEFIFYKEFLNQFPDYKPYREYDIGISENKKIDMVFENDKEIYLIEIDDRQHFYCSSERYMKDIIYSRYIMNQYETEKKLIFIRIDDRLIKNETIQKTIEEIKLKSEMNLENKQIQLIGVNPKLYDHIRGVFRN